MSEGIRERWRQVVRQSMSHVDSPADDRYWCPELETVSRDRLRALQEQRVVLAYQYLWECSPFYRAKFERAGLNADSIKSLADLGRIPVTRREEWLENQEANPPWGTFSPLRQEDWTERGWMLFTTSGTTAGQPRVFRHTTHDRDLWSWLG
ncbi:MAG: phenylacetate--CoA ligase family protein, partial [Singulisphaera sp.]